MVEQHIQTILDKIVLEYERLLEDNLIGIYLHGSLAMGCFNEKFSDIDYIVIVKEKIPFEIKKRIIDFILNISQYVPIEMSIILEKDIKQFIYPTPFELHYSKEHSFKYVNDAGYICGDSVDKDLAAHVTVIKYRGVCLHGRPIHEVFGQVPEEYYLDSILYDIEDVQEEITNNPVYYVLNLCRVLYYLRERVVSSKYEGGEWAKGILPGKYFDLIEEAINIYIGKMDNINVSKEELIHFAEYMLKEINSCL